uniref:BTB domain-containing protein n=1 Tax=Schizophyllum commune (strain H4-8 / FGSC 9210) TaxID=578458 RepID=D8Q649_SCHCM
MEDDGIYYDYQSRWPPSTLLRITSLPPHSMNHPSFLESMPPPPQPPFASPIPPFVRSPGPVIAGHIWPINFPDANLVLTVDRRRFAVHRSVLEIQSPEFLRGAYRGPDGREHVNLRHVSSRSVRNFLMAVYYPNFFPAPFADVPLVTIGDVLLVATRYRVYALRARALAHLQALTLHCIVPPSSTLARAGISGNTALVKALVELAEQANALWLLPLLLYYLSCIPLKRLAAPETYEGVLYELSSETRLRIAEGFRRSRDPDYTSLTALKSMRCWRPWCRRARKTFLQAKVTSHFYLDPLRHAMVWGAMINVGEAPVKGMCSQCCAILQKNLSDFELSFIRSIPGNFGLPTLEDLEEWRKADLGVHYSAGEEAQAMDAVHFLKAMYIPNYFMPPPAQTRFNVLEGILRLAHKYDAPAMRCRALRHLESAFVTNLAEMDYPPNRTYPLVPNDGPQEIKAVIRLYPASSLLSKEVWLGLERSLSHEDIAACFAGCEALRKEFPHVAFFSPNLGCASEGCIKARLASCSAEDRVRFVQHPLTYFTQWVDSDDGLEEMCWKCMDSMRANYHVWLRDVWRRLPSFFNLPDWSALARVRKLDLTEATSRKRQDLEAGANEIAMAH